MAIGDTIRIKREELGMTQKELADKLFVSRQTVSRWESGSRCPDLIISRKIASTLGLSMDELIPSQDESFARRDEKTEDNETVFAGFDCGGSNTRCMLVSKDGRILGRGKGGPSNYLFCGKLAARDALKESIKEAFADASLPPRELKGAFIASAAVEVFCGSSHESFFKEVTGCRNVECNSDVFPVWYAGSRFEPAVVMIAGTGSVAYLLEGKGFVKANGWGPLFGDEGSGYYIGINAIRRVSQMTDRRRALDEEFCNALLEHFNVPRETPRQLLRILNQSDYQKRAASATEVVLRLYETGNTNATELINDAAEELACSINALAERANGSFSLILSGGLLQNDTPLRRILLEKVSVINNISKIVTPKCDAVLSAAAIALRSNGYDDAAERLMRLAGGAPLC